MSESQSDPPREDSKGMEVLFFASGYLSLLLTEAFGLGYAAFWGIGLFAYWRRSPRKSSPVSDRITMICLLLFAMGDAALHVGQPGHRQFASLLSWAILLALNRPGSRSPLGFAAVGNLGLLVCSGTLTTSVAFAIGALGFIVSTAGLLTFQALIQPRGSMTRRVGLPFLTIETNPGPLPPSASPAPRHLRLRGLIGLVSFGVTLCGIFLFFIIPRYGAGWFFAVDRNPMRQVGFSDRVSFGAIGELQSSAAIAMRVQLIGQDQPLPDGLRLRGVALDQFDGKTWTESKGENQVFKDTARGLRESRLYVGHAPWKEYRTLKQRIFLTSDLDGVLFGAPRIVDLWGKFTKLEATLNQSLLVKFPAFSTRSYVVTSHVGGPTPEEMRDADRYESREKASQGGTSFDKNRYLQLPTRLDARISDLAGRLTAGKTSRFDRTRAIETYLRNEFTCALEPVTPENPEDPLVEFLFSRRRGHCEYFSASMAILCRTAGIPARIVNGFLATNFNPIGSYYPVASAEAHSWVEVHFPVLGWITFDPTPAAEPVSPSWVKTLSHQLRNVIDGVKMAWSVYVIDYHILDQVAYIRALSAWFRSEESGPRDISGVRSIPSPRSFPRIFLFLVLILAVLFAGWALLQRAMTDAPDRPRDRASALYLEMISLLKRKGLEHPESSTPRQAVERARVGWPEACQTIQSFVSWFESIRYGGEPLTPEDLKLAEEMVKILRKLSSTRLES